MTLIGITGTHGAGKGTITKYLVRVHDFIYVSVSEFLAQEAERRGMVADRIARQEIANEYRAEGPTALMEAAYLTIPADAERVILEPQYTEDEVRFIHDKGGFVFAIDADVKARYDRVHMRGSLKDDVTFEAFKKEQEKELNSIDPNKQNMALAMAVADVHHINDGSVEELERHVEDALTSLGIV